MTASPGAWVELTGAGLHALAFRTPRCDVAFWKHLYESFEDVAIIRTAAHDGEEAILAVVAPPDFLEEARAILDDVIRRGTPPVSPAELPVGCREDWFLAEWETR